MKRVIGAIAAALIVSSVAGCGSDETPKTVTVTVFAASSLKGSFTEIGRKFEAEHDGTIVTFNFGGSSDLVAQIQQGAPADVFASADTPNMDKAVTGGLVEGQRTNFATNTLEIATPPDNPAKVDSLDDLARDGIKVVLCAPEVPCGAAAAGVEKAAGVDIAPVSEEQSVTDVVGKVVSGEADAGLVYVTDVKAAGEQVGGVTFPEASEVVNTYPIAALKRSEHKVLAQMFADYVTGPKGRAVLAAAGFGKP